MVWSKGGISNWGPAWESHIRRRRAPQEPLKHSVQTSPLSLPSCCRETSGGVRPAENSFRFGQRPLSSFVITRAILALDLGQDKYEYGRRGWASWGE